MPHDCGSCTGIAKRNTNADRLRLDVFVDRELLIAILGARFTPNAVRNSLS